MTTEARSAFTDRFSIDVQIYAVMHKLPDFVVIIRIPYNILLTCTIAVIL